MFSATVRIRRSSNSPRVAPLDCKERSSLKSSEDASMREEQVIILTTALHQRKKIYMIDNYSEKVFQQMAFLTLM